MTILELKNRISSLKPREINELHAYLARLRHTTPEWKKATARKIRAVQAGRFISEEQIEEHLARG
jgi:hypothetical protein